MELNELINDLRRENERLRKERDHYREGLRRISVVPVSSDPKIAECLKYYEISIETGGKVQRKPSSYRAQS